MFRGGNIKYHYKLKYRKNYNILAKDFGVIYFNTQKNANSTMKAQFVEILGMTKTKNFPRDIHHKYDFPTASQSEIKSQYEDFLRFSILRNPWERLVSCYNNKIAKSSSTGKDLILESSPDLYIGMSFKDFVEVICEIPDSEADYHFCSQSYLMFYPDGYFPINYICNIENLAFHIEELKSLTGIPFSPLPNLNRSASSSYVDFYTPELIEQVRQRYHIDIAFFNYEFGKKNDVFPFGFIKDDLKKVFTQSPLMIPILIEKNRELVKTIESNRTRMTELEQIAQSVNFSERILGSILWKTRVVLRRLRSFFYFKNQG